MTLVLNTIRAISLPVDLARQTEDCGEVLLRPIASLQVVAQKTCPEATPLRVCGRP